MALPSAYKGGEEVAFPALVAGHDEVHDLLVGILDHLLARSGGVGP